MTCKHLQKFFQLCQQHDIKMSSSDVVRIACGECQRIEVCPAVMLHEHEWQSSANDERLDMSQPSDEPGISLKTGETLTFEASPRDHHVSEHEQQ